MEYDIIEIKESTESRVRTRINRNYIADINIQGYTLTITFVHGRMYQIHCRDVNVAEYIYTHLWDKDVKFFDIMKSGGEEE